MEWLVVAIIGGVMGLVASFAGTSIRMPQALTITLGVIGALAGAFLIRITGFNVFGAWSFYLAGAVLALGLLAGGFLAYTITHEEHRV